MIKEVVLITCIIMLCNKRSFAQSYDYSTDLNDSSFSKIADAVSGYKIIGLGESAHGVKEFHKWDYSFVTYLIKKGQLKVVMLEDNYDRLRKIDDYVQGNNPALNIDSLVRHDLYTIWQSPELLKLIAFVRDHNAALQSTADRVHILGADMQDAGGIYDVNNFFRNRNISVQRVTDRDLELVAGLGKGEKYNFKRLPAEDKQRIRETIDFFQKNFDELSKRTELASSEDFIFALQDFSIVKQCFENTTAGIFKWIRFRNEALARNVLWAENSIAKGKKVVFIAHNGHIADASLSTGKYIKRAMPEYYALLQDFAAGEIANTYTGNRTQINAVNEKGMIAAFFSDRNGNLFFADFNDQAFKGSGLSDFMKSNNKIHSYGADNSGSLNIKPNVTCSGIIIYKNVTSSL